MKILIVDNNEMVQKICILVLERLGHNINTVSTGHEALNVLSGEKYDALFLELFLPDMSGLSVLEKIKDQNMLSVILTNYHSVDLIRRAAELGAASYMFKPIDPDTLEATLAMGMKQYEMNLARLESKQKLLDSQQKYKALIDLVTEGMVIVQDGVIRFVNKSMADMLNLKLTRIINRNMKDVFVAKGADRVYQRMERFIKSGIPLEGNFGFRDHRGREFTVFITSRKMNYQNRPADMFVFQDITERVEMDKKITKIEERYRVIHENASDAFYLIHQDGSIHDMNRKAELLLGYSKTELLSQNIRDLIPNDEQNRFSVIFNELRNLGGIPPSEIHFRHKGGAWIPVEMSAVFIDYESYLIIACDLSQNKQEEQRMHECENSFQLLQENIPGFFYRSLLSGEYLSVNNSIEILTQYQASEFLHGGKKWLEVVFGADRDRVLEEQTNVRAGEKNILEYRIIDKSGNMRWVEDRRYYYFDPETKNLCVCGIVCDRTLERAKDEKHQETEKRYQALIENMPALVYRMKYNNGFSLDFLNHYVKTLLGYSAEEACQEQENMLIQRIHASDRTHILQHIERCIVDGVSGFVLEYRMCHKNGRMVQVVNRGAIHKTGSGEIEVEGTIAEVWQKGEEWTPLSQNKPNENREKSFEHAQEVKISSL